MEWIKLHWHQVFALCLCPVVLICFVAFSFRSQAAELKTHTVTLLPQNSWVSLYDWADDETKVYHADENGYMEQYFNSSYYSGFQIGYQGNNQNLVNIEEGYGMEPVSVSGSITLLIYADSTYEDRVQKIFSSVRAFHLDVPDGTAVSNLQYDFTYTGTPSNSNPAEFTITFTADISDREIDFSNLTFGFYCVSGVDLYPSDSFFGFKMQALPGELTFSYRVTTASDKMYEDLTTPDPEVSNKVDDYKDNAGFVSSDLDDLDGQMQGAVDDLYEKYPEAQNPFGNLPFPSNDGSFFFKELISYLWGKEILQAFIHFGIVFCLITFILRR